MIEEMIGAELETVEEDTGKKKRKKRQKKVRQRNRARLCRMG